MQSEYSKVLALFAKYLAPAVWQHAQILLAGAILARGRRTVAAVLRVMGLSAERHFVNYHRVLNRAVWSSLAISQTRLQSLLQVFVPSGPIILPFTGFRFDSEQLSLYAICATEFERELLGAKISV